MADWTAAGVESPAGLLPVEECLIVLRQVSAGDVVDRSRAESALLSAAWIARNGESAGSKVLAQLLESAQESEVPRFVVSREIIAASFAIRMDRYQDVLAHARRGREIALKYGMELEAGVCCGIAGTASYRLGDYERARIHYEEALVAARRTHSRTREAAALADLGLVLKNQGQLRAAEHNLRQALALYELVGSPAHAGRCLLNLALVLTRTSQFPEAQSLLLSAEQTFIELRSGAFLTSVRLALGRVHRVMGNWAQAREALEAAYEAAAAAGSPRDIVLALEFLGDLLMDEKDARQALELFEEALTKSRSVGERGDLVVESSRRVAGALLALGEQQERQLQLAQESANLAREQGDLFELVQSMIVLGDVMSATGKARLARESLQAARSLASGLGAAYEQSVAALKLSKLDLRLGRIEEALSLVVEARRITQLCPKAEVSQEVGAVYREALGRIDSEDTAQSQETVASAESPITGFIATESKLIEELQTCIKLAVHNINILVLGESGTGKELVAQAIHKESDRKGPFVPVNCSAFPGDLLEGELFGHARGAYTGADRERSGLIEFAHRGTLFLDEIGDMPLKAQARLLRALESGEVRRLGENSPRVVDVRVVAATHRDLLQMVSSGEFRLDLYYRLAGYVLNLPPVREREGDARLLVEHFLHEICAEQDKQVALSNAVKQQLATYSWPGNVREIRNVIHRLVSISEHGRIVRQLPFDLEGAPRARTLPEALEVEERKRIVDALRANHWNKTRAAAALGSSRTTLIGKMRRLGIEPPSDEAPSR